MSRPRTSQRAKRAHSIFSDTSFTPAATPTPATRRAGVSTRGVRALTAESDAPTPTPAPPAGHARGIPGCYSLAPEIPSPFAGTLEASLDAILSFGQYFDGLDKTVTTLLEPVDAGTNWPVLLHGKQRAVVEELLFLVTRTLLPEQVKENRDVVGRMYERKKHLAIRMALRYDLLREWKVDGGGHVLCVPSVPVEGEEDEDAEGEIDLDIDASKGIRGKVEVYKRKELLPNVLPTLISAPSGGWTTHGVRERMKHHVTALDDYLLLSDKEVARWDDETVRCMTAMILLQWQWLRRNNEMLEEMEMNGWEELEGRADECEWIVEEGKRKRAKGGEGGEAE